MKGQASRNRMILQISYIAKSVAYNDYDGVCLFVGRKEDETVPFTFYYFFALDIDQQKPVKMTFQRRGKTDSFNVLSVRRYTRRYNANHA